MCHHDDIAVSVKFQVLEDIMRVFLLARFLNPFRVAGLNAGTLVPVTRVIHVC
jgi:hypothetical protein